MAALAEDANYKFSEQTLKGRNLPAVASDIVYKHSALGDASGYAQPLSAGDRFLGFAVEQVDNSSGSAGDKYVEVYHKGEVELSVTSAAVTDIGKPVYASDDNTFTFTSGSNTYIGCVVAWVETGKVLVSFDVSRGGLGGVLTGLTDSSGGTADDTVAAVSGSGDDATINNNFADLAAKINELIKRLDD